MQNTPFRQFSNLFKYNKKYPLKVQNIPKFGFSLDFHDIKQKYQVTSL